MSNATHLTTVGAGTGEWRTPPDLFARLNERFQFTYDAFASHENALCDKYSTIAGTFRKYPGAYAHERGTLAGVEEIDSLDGLHQDWDRRRVWMNPPYGRGILAQAMEKAAASRNSASIIVALIPANTDTGWWHEHVKPYATVHFLQKRVKFIDPVTGEPGGSPPGGSAIAVYYPDWLQ
jgi:hypothetical protein